MLRKIIVGCDDGPGTRDAVRFAALLARSARAELILANVYRDDRAAALDLVTAIECRVPYGTRAQIRVVRSGSPAHALHDLADAEHADLIVIGQGRNARGHAGFVTHSHCPVALAPAGFADEADAGLRVIGVAFDGSSESRAAVDLAAELALGAQATIRLIGVAQRPPGPAVGMTGAWIDAEFDYRDALRREMETVADGLPPALRAQVVLADGEPAAALVEHAAPLSLLVTGSHGRGPILRALLGSVSDAVLRQAPCPVLVVPAAAELRQAAA